MSKKTKIISAIIIGVVFLLVFGSERNRAALFINSNGYIEQGKKFGVEIGSPLENGIAHFEQMGLSVYSVTQGGRCIFRQYNSNFMVTVLADDSWRRGGVCIVSKDNVIFGIGWSYNPFSP
ncbi:MAG: hypothetical protein Q9M33_13440 [Robiginitomaculum sp.]|nr:hypothetical protein [Robiginitomaculum sp.]